MTAPPPHDPSQHQGRQVPQASQGSQELPPASPAGDPQFTGPPAPAAAKGKKTGLVVAIAAVLVAGAGTAAFLLFGGESDEDKVNALAEQMATAINEKDAELASSLSCDGATEGSPDDVPDGVEAQPGAVTVTGDSGTVGLKISWLGKSLEMTFEAEKRGDEWCVGEPVE
ncbi:hypothetical protein SAXI111661_10195 [Saccharomonospora xinjiangensis]|uniref:hypothetical protein n=1 Tax=Saccharomonospora xinjiangensis TaxID=75294 RepID=UPI00106FEB4B|nr:hypothetical protein [Saccharomonospora xinjiangensis]QBQ60814.1 hypothetical protein EYD13_12305 [Saccharomonospora xinjiangensis]